MSFKYNMDLGGGANPVDALKKEFEKTLDVVVEKFDEAKNTLQDVGDKIIDAGKQVTKIKDYFLMAWAWLLLHIDFFSYVGIIFLFPLFFGMLQKIAIFNLLLFWRFMTLAQWQKRHNGAKYPWTASRVYNHITVRNRNSWWEK